MAEYELKPSLVLSTSHITRETADWLNAQGEIAATQYRNPTDPKAYPAIHMASHVYGWFLHVYDPQEWMVDIEAPDAVKKCLLKIFEYANDRKINWIELDCDASDIESLPTYEWDEPAPLSEPNSFTVYGTYGRMVVVTATGEIIDLERYEGANPDAYAYIYRFDAQEWRGFFGTTPGEKSIDIVDIGFWTDLGIYVSAGSERFNT